MQNVERMGAWDARRNSDQLGNRQVWRTGDGDGDEFRSLSATPASDARGRARTIVLTLSEFKASTWLADDQACDARGAECQHAHDERQDEPPHRPILSNVGSHCGRYVGRSTAGALTRENQRRRLASEAHASRVTLLLTG